MHMYIRTSNLLDVDANLRTRLELASTIYASKEGKRLYISMNRLILSICTCTLDGCNCMYVHVLMFFFIFVKRVVNILPQNSAIANSLFIKTQKMSRGLLGIALTKKTEKPISTYYFFLFVYMHNSMLRKSL